MESKVFLLFSHPHLDARLEEILDHLEVLVLDGDAETAAAERVHAVDVEDGLLLAQGGDHALHEGQVATLNVQEEELRSM